MSFCPDCGCSVQFHNGVHKMTLSNGKFLIEKVQ